MRSRSLLFATVCLGFSVAAHAASDAQADNTAASQQPGATISPSPSIRTDYVIQPGDTLHVIVFQEDDLTRDVKVSAESTITLPLIGLMELKGLTPRDAQEAIRRRYDADYLVNPQVNVTVVDYSRRSVNVIGSVNNPGAVLFPQEEGMTLLDAITRAGGFSRLADKKHVKLSRTNPQTGRLDVVIINADDIISGSSSEQITLLKDDVIYVPERVI
jgi:polysaccharide export outer membrane protein